MYSSTGPGAVPAEWNVFGAEGRMIGRAAMPAGSRATHIGADWVLGVWTGEDGVEYVRMYGLAT